MYQNQVKTKLKECKIFSIRTDIPTPRFCFLFGLSRNMASGIPTRVVPYPTPPHPTPPYTTLPFCTAPYALVGHAPFPAFFCRRHLLPSHVPPPLTWKLSFFVLSGDWVGLGLGGRSKLQAIQGAPHMDFDRTTYYKIPFWQAADLIGKRQVKPSSIPRHPPPPLTPLLPASCELSFPWLSYLS